MLQERTWNIPVHRRMIGLYSQSGVTGTAERQIKLGKDQRTPRCSAREVWVAPATAEFSHQQDLKAVWDGEQREAII